jgi:hypothetical protein
LKIFWDGEKNHEQSVEIKGRDVVQRADVSVPPPWAAGVDGGSGKCKVENF